VGSFLAALLLCVKMLQPPGLMPAAVLSTAWPICSEETHTAGHADAPAGQHDQDPLHADCPCVCCWQMPALPPTLVVVPALTRVAYATAEPIRSCDLFPGRGLAAPPPPAHAPPTETI